VLIPPALPEGLTPGGGPGGPGRAGVGVGRPPGGGGGGGVGVPVGEPPPDGGGGGEPGGVGVAIRARTVGAAALAPVAKSMANAPLGEKTWAERGLVQQRRGRSSKQDGHASRQGAGAAVRKFAAARTWMLEVVVSTTDNVARVGVDLRLGRVDADGRDAEVERDRVRRACDGTAPRPRQNVPQSTSLVTHPLAKQVARL
jgi:hypothetical protein